MIYGKTLDSFHFSILSTTFYPRIIIARFV
jgi:hypothetical protein